MSSHDPARAAEAAAFDLVTAAVRAVAGSDDLDRVLSTILRALVEHVGAAAGAVFLIDQDRGAIELAASTGVELVEGEALTGALDDPEDPIARAARERRSVTVDTGEEHRGSLVEHCGLAEGLFEPLIVSRGRLDLEVGVLALCWSDRRPPADRLAVVRPVSDMAALAVDRSRVLSLVMERSEWFERLAHTDPLTGLANRRTLDRMLELELARAGRQGGELTVALFGVDGFAEAVASGGHPAGDDLLRAVAAVLAESVRLVDTVCRYGPAEFVLVAPGGAGTVVAERVLAGVRALPGAGGRTASVSAGVVHFPGDGTSAAELLEAATRAFEKARIAGGGRVATLPAS